MRYRRHTPIRLEGWFFLVVSCAGVAVPEDAAPESLLDDHPIQSY